MTEAATIPAPAPPPGPGAAAPPLEVRDVSLAYGGVKALHQVSFTAELGKITCIMGRNGVGKTSLMRAVMGVLPVTGGTIKLHGADLTKAPSYKRARAGIALVPQGREIFPKLTVDQNLQVALAARSDGVRTVPEDVLDLFPILRSMSKRMGGDLSGGQQQQLAIARALTGNPKVLLLDEPTEGIQPNIIQHIGEVLRLLVEKRGLTIVLVEQYLDFVKEFGHHFAIMDRGQFVASGAIDGLNQDLISRHLSV